MKRKILFFDDEGYVLKPYLRELEKDFDVHFFEDITNGEKILANHPDIKLLILDVMMPTPEGVASSATNDGHSTGTWFLKQIRGIVVNRPLPVIVLTNKGKSAITAEIQKLGIDEKLVVLRTKSEAGPNQLRALAKELVDAWHP